MTSESIKLYKLIILYFLNRTKNEITNAILSDFILEYGYTDYFSIQETLCHPDTHSFLLYYNRKRAGNPGILLLQTSKGHDAAN